jgi:S-DNA-T family DNA segregation ATPase FtsK/SpoIIIE
MDGMRDLLDYQADQIERVLASHGVPGRVYGGAVSPRLVEFHLAPAAGVRIARIEALEEELAMYLGVSTCRVQRRGAVVSIEVPKEHQPVVNLLTLMSDLTQHVPAASAVLGQDNEGLPVVLRLSSPDVGHVLVTGTTGSGKTELARSMILSLALCNAPEELRLLLIDPKGRGYKAFAALPHLVCPVVSDVAEAHVRLEGLVAEMERRDRAAESEPQVIVFVDELADLMMVGGKQMIQTMTRLTQRGREAGIHIVACTQKPTAAIVGGLVKSNFPARLLGSVASADDARIAAGISGTGAERLAGRGDFLLVVKGEVQRIQAAYSPSEELAAAVARLTVEGAPAPRPQAKRGPSADSGRSGRGDTPHDDEAGDGEATTADEDDEPFVASEGKPMQTDQEQAAAAGDAFHWRSINEHLRLGSRRT